MKVTATQATFNPVTVQITLETQEEFDRLFAVTNHTDIQKIGGLEKLWIVLRECGAFRYNYVQYHEALGNIMK